METVCGLYHHLKIKIVGYYDILNLPPGWCASPSFGQSNLSFRQPPWLSSLSSHPDGVSLFKLWWNIQSFCHIQRFRWVQKRFFCCIFWPWNYQGEWFWTGGLRGSRSLDHGQTKNMNLGRVGIAYLPTPPVIPWWSMHNCITDSATTSCPRNTHISMMAMMQSFCPQVGTGDHAPACDWEVPSLCCFFSSWRLRAGGAKKRLWAWVVCVYMYL